MDYKKEIGEVFLKKLDEMKSDENFNDRLSKDEIFSYEYSKFMAQIQDYSNYSIKRGDLPAILIDAEVLPEAMDKAILEVWDKGISVKTHYDKPGDPQSKEATVMIRIRNPLAEPRLYKNYPGSGAALEEYRLEVVHGIHNHWIAPGTEKWTYTYHERFFENQPSENLNAPDRGILISRSKLREALKEAKTNNWGLDYVNHRLENGYLDIPKTNQIAKIIADLRRDITSKGAQATTWMPTADPGLESNRPCMQIGWFRSLETEIKGKKGYQVNLDMLFRSRDLYKAAFMNIWALTDFQRSVTKGLEKEIGMPCIVGNYNDTSFSLHIYGAYFNKETKTNEEMESTIARIRKTPWTDRAWSLNDPDIPHLEEMLEARHVISAKLDWEKKTGNKGTYDPNLTTEQLKSYPYPMEWDE